MAFCEGLLLFCAVVWVGCVTRVGFVFWFVFWCGFVGAIALSSDFAGDVSLVCMGVCWGSVVSVVDACWDHKFLTSRAGRKMF